MNPVSFGRTVPRPATVVKRNRSLAARAGLVGGEPPWYQRGMKLLSDFDGVWTHPGAEASAQGEVLDARLVEAVPPEARDAARAWVAEARRAIAAEPTRWGWAPGGRLSAFADEDPFGAHSAMLHLLSERAAVEPLAAAIRDGATTRGSESLEAFGLASHLEAVARVEAARGPGVLAPAAAAGRDLLAAGAEVVIVSNSATEKLERWFTHAAVPHDAHPTRSPGTLRLRGSARKHVLDDAGSEPLALDGVRVETRRPHYEVILREEAPNAIVGDVFSLDLALPLRLVRHESGWSNVRLFWLVHDYTPARMKRVIATAAPEVETIEDGLPAVVAALLRG